MSIPVPLPTATLHLIPLLKKPLFPGMVVPVSIGQGLPYNTLKMITSRNERFLGLCLSKWGDKKDTWQVEDLHPVGVVAKIMRIITQDEGVQALMSMEKRFQILRPIADPNHLRAEISLHEDPSQKELGRELKAYSINIIKAIKELLTLNPLFKEELQGFLSHADFTEPGKLADFASALTTSSREELQDILATFDIEQRIDKALLLLKKELDLSRLQSNINQKIESAISKTQREFFLREQLRTIKKELGLEKDERSYDIDKFEKRLEDRSVPVDVQKTIDEELDKLRMLDGQSAEYTLCRHYLDWLTILPWGVFSEETPTLEEAEKVLTADHYSLEDIKNKVLEWISVGKLSGTMHGQLLCLVGPPGVGKTSVGRSIAKALGRKFFRFSVGGMRDEAEIKGHRRTYVGAMPGKIIQALKSTQTMDPVLMIDEIDKLSVGMQGDPAAALLEVLDPEQNAEFLDHYLDVRCDLSRVLFIMTANVLDAIPAPLRDRTEVLRLSGYILEEKVEIAVRHLLPKHLSAMGLKGKEVSLSKQTLAAIVDGYAREAGLRNLERQIKKILRQVTLVQVRSKEKGEGKKRFIIRPADLEQYLGKASFSSDTFYEQTPIGVCMGLAWTPLGGATLYVEATQTDSKSRGMKLTGQAGDVMRESSQIAWTYLHSKVELFTPRKDFFTDREVHLHIPEGATPKDGPSAGIAMATALLSLLREQKIVQSLGMSGELTLLGKVLPIGGVKEKVIAARRSKVRKLIFPADNRKEVETLPAHLRKGMKIHFVTDYTEVANIAFAKR